MNAFFAAITRFGIGRLAAILGIGIGVAAVLAAVSMQFGEPKALLYSNLDLKEAGTITQALDQAGVKYEVKGDGSTIMVARDQVATTRIMLSSRGLPTAGSVGYEIFDEQNALGQTDFIQQLNRQRALEGELARTIRSLQGVTSARVHLVLPKRQLFEEEAEQPSAAVTISVGGREPTPEQVRAMQNLVAGAVPNLRPDRVTVVDQNAKTLSSGEVGIAGEADSRKGEVEQRIGKQVQKLVEGVVGPGKVRVNVTADLDLARVTEQREEFNPDGQVVRSESTNEENARDTQPQPGGDATVAANIPGGAQDPNATGSQSGRTDSTTNYEISKTVTTRVTEPGQVRRLSVAVAVDGVTAPGANGQPGAYTARTAEEMQRIETLVRAAVGFDQARGDQVSVINVRFPTADSDAGVEAGDPLFAFDKNDIMRGAELGVLALVGLLIVFFVARPLLSGINAGAAARNMIAQVAGGPAIARMVTTSDGQQVAVGHDGQLALPPPTSELEERIDIARIEGQVKASSVKRVSEFVEKHPDESVSIIRNWLHESS